MAKILGHEIVNAEEFGQFVDGEYTKFKTAVQETSKANAEMLIHFANTTEKHKKEIKFLKIALAVCAIAIGILVVMH